jgi:hypothetical protein
MLYDSMINGVVFISTIVSLRYFPSLFLINLAGRRHGK